MQYVLAGSPVTTLAQAVEALAPIVFALGYARWYRRPLLRTAGAALVCALCGLSVAAIAKVGEIPVMRVVGLAIWASGPILVVLKARRQ